MQKNKRALWHDYRLPARYMITLLKSPGAPSLSSIELKDSTKALSPDNIYTRWSDTGSVIARLLYNIAEFSNDLLVEQYSIMPDHVHFLLLVKTRLPDHLGSYVARLKIAINNYAGAKNIFSEGFNDQILTPDRSLDSLFRYIRENPYRLAVRRSCPEYFQRRSDIVINNMAFQAYGNLQLLDHPFKEQIVVHRSDDEPTILRNLDRWSYTAANGGILVSPFVSPREKEIRKKVENLGGRMILISPMPFANREKPSAYDFSLCTEGRLLIISPLEPLLFSRAACLKMNSIAQAIATANNPAIKPQS